MRLRSLTAFGALAGLLLAGWAAAQPNQPGFPGRGGRSTRGGGQEGRLAPVGRPTWEYRTLERADLMKLAAEKPVKDQLTGGLNNLGADGWELIAGLGSGEFIFKRPAPRTPRGWTTALAEPPAPAGPPAAAASEFRVFRLKNAAAADMERILSKLFQAGGRGAGALRVASDERTNSVLASGAREQLDEVEAVLNRLDTSDGGKAPGKK